MIHIDHNNSSYIIYKKSDCEKSIWLIWFAMSAGDSNQIIGTQPSQPQRTPEMSPACP